MEKKVLVKAIATYNGHNIKQSGSVDLSLVCPYDELANYIQLIQMLNNDVNLAIRMAGDKPFKLGMFKIKEIKVCDDGEGVIKFNSMTDFVEVDNLNKMVTKDRFEVRFTAEIEIENGGEKENDNESE
jgi:hypothetical protein